jgi:hypothetical protein
MVPGLRWPKLVIVPAMFGLSIPTFLAATAPSLKLLLFWRFAQGLPRWAKEASCCAIPWLKRLGGSGGEGPFAVEEITLEPFRPGTESAVADLR